MNGEEMNSASILVNMASTAPTAPANAGTEQASAGKKGFDQALASAQSQSSADDAHEDGPVSPELASSLLVRGALPAAAERADKALVAEDALEDGSDAAVDAAGSGAAAILAQMLAGSTPQGGAETPPVADAASQAISSQAAGALPRGAKPAAEGTAIANTAGEGGKAAAGATPDAITAALDSPAAESQSGVSALLQEKSFELPPAGGQSPSLSQAGTTAQAVAQAAASALRDATPAAATSASAHASLREPVGTARWADELGNHLVLMSVRGQQQGSLTLTPEHLGPVEVQISMNRDTANVWFGAQHADTRTALAEAMPRLRELLAASGLSLGQSGVSEQAPRENPVPPAALQGGALRGMDAEAVAERPAPAWRVWRPGHIDTYA